MQENTDLLVSCPASRTDYAVLRMLYYLTERDFEDEEVENIEASGSGDVPARDPTPEIVAKPPIAVRYNDGATGPKFLPTILTAGTHPPNF